MNRLCKITRIVVPAVALLFYWIVGAWSPSDLSLMDHYSYHASYAVWIFVPYALWIVIGHRFDATAPFITSGMLLLLLAVVVHVRMVVFFPQVNMLSILISPFFQLFLLMVVYAAFYLTRRFKTT